MFLFPATCSQETKNSQENPTGKGKGKVDNKQINNKIKKKKYQRNYAEKPQIENQVRRNGCREKER